MNVGSVVRSYACAIADAINPATYVRNQSALEHSPDMDYTRLGRSDALVSVVGLGAGGPSRLGRAKGASARQSVRLVRAALDAGINFLDTSEAYGTERIIGRAIRRVDRDKVYLSTKKLVVDGGGEVISGRELRLGLECSLRRLGSDHVDFYLLHAVRVHQYEHIVKELIPALYALREQGKIRYIGVSEAFSLDPSHEMLSLAIRDDYWDVVLVGFNPANSSARTIFETTKKKNIGVLSAFAVRDLIENGAGLTVRAGGDPGVDCVQAELAGYAYRFCRHEPGVNVVLIGTGSVDHLMSDIRSCMQPPIPMEIMIEREDR